jgi:hypothetical protein
MPKLLVFSIGGYLMYKIYKGIEKKFAKEVQ